MQFLGTVFTEVFYRPIFNILIFFYNIEPTGELVVSIFFTLLIVRVLLLPFAIKNQKSQAKMKSIQKDLEKIKKRFGHDKKVMMQKTSELYKEKKINPSGSCLSMILQLFVFAAMYKVFSAGIKDNLDKDLIYPFVKSLGDLPNHLNTEMFGFIDLTRNTGETIFGMAIIFTAGVIQYIQSAYFMPKAPKPTKDSTDQERITYEMSKQMKFMFPLLTIFIGLGFPVGMGVYWVMSSAFSILQMYILGKLSDKNENESRESSRS